MKIVVTGGSGFLGRALIKKFRALNYEVVALGHSEKKTTDCQREMDCQWYIGDITNNKFTDQYIKGDLVIHAAAQKHIPIAENQPAFAVENNIIGTINIFRSAISNGVKEVVFISTDKAYQPETIYGKTKEFGEWLCEYYNRQNLKTKFYWCRYGNVGGSSGSVFEIWDALGKRGENIGLTIPGMTRFFFTIDDAVDTVLETLKRKNTKRPFIPRMKAMRLGDVANVFADHYGVRVKVIGNRGQEKIHEGMSDRYQSNTCQRYNKTQIEKFLKKIGCLTS